MPKITRSVKDWEDKISPVELTVADVMGHPIEVGQKVLFKQKQTYKTVTHSARIVGICSDGAVCLEWMEREEWHHATVSKGTVVISDCGNTYQIESILKQ